MDANVKFLLVNPLRPRDIALQDSRATIFFNGKVQPKKPHLTTVLVNNIKTTAIFWWSDIDNNPRYYPISTPACPEFEHIHLLEFDIIFLGTTQQLSQTELHNKFVDLPAKSPEEFISILAVNHKLFGFGGRNMNALAFPCSVAIRINDDGKALTPKTFCLEKWRPAVDTQPTPFLKHAC